VTGSPDCAHPYAPLQAPGNERHHENEEKATDRRTARVQAILREFTPNHHRAPNVEVFLPVSPTSASRSCRESSAQDTVRPPRPWAIDPLRNGMHYVGNGNA
jgi:hypothetical protein